MTELRTYLRCLVGATVLLYVVLALVVAYVLITSFRTHDALCSLRSDLQVRVAASEAFLKTHPNGLGDIPASAIRTGIDNQKRTIEALRGLNC